MKKIIGKSSTGKTKKLMVAAHEANGVIICKNVEKFRNKAYNYGFTNIDFLSYEDYFTKNEILEKPVFIDEAEDFLKYGVENFSGYTITSEEDN